MKVNITLVTMITWAPRTSREVRVLEELGVEPGEGEPEEGVLIQVASWGRRVGGHYKRAQESGEEAGGSAPGGGGEDGPAHPGDAAMPDELTFDADAAIDRLMRFLAVEGVTGREKAIAKEVRQALLEAGVPASAIKYDRAHERIPLPTQTGNLIVTLPGTRPG